LLFDFISKVASVGGANSATMKIDYKKVSDSTYTNFINDGTFTGLLDTTTMAASTKVINTTTFLIDTAYHVKVTISDFFTTVTSVYEVPTAKPLLDFKANKKGLGVGAVAALDNVFDIGFQTRFTGGILQRVLESGTDFNNVTTPNTYTLKNTGSANYVNCPIPTGTGTLKVEACGVEGQIRQVVTVCSKDNPLEYERFYYQSSWGNWRVSKNDTGWVNLTLQSGITVGSEYGKLQGRYKDGVLHIKGDVKGISSSYKMFATLPTALQVVAEDYRRFAGVYNVGYFCGFGLLSKYQLYVTLNPTGAWDSTKNVSIDVALCV
jgi:hypothetical protein